MASIKADKSGPPHNKGGQGTVEAVVALPVFLLLICILFQLFLVAIAQVQLRYAAFCAARVGAVRNADIKEMNSTVGKILSGTTGFIPAVARSFRVEIIELQSVNNTTSGQASNQFHDLLKVRVLWDYPLTVPLVNTLWSGIHDFRSPFTQATVPLQATWTTVRFELNTEKSDGK